MWRFVVVLGAVAACGDGTGAFTDAAVPADGNPAAGLARIHVANRGQPQVFFQAADSRVLLATTTNVHGDASAFVEPDSFVTVFSEDGDGGRELWTYAGVQPGDDLVIDFSTPLLTDPSDLSPGSLFKLNATLDFTFGQPPPDATRYVLRTVCGTFEIDPVHGALPYECPPTADLLVIALREGGSSETGDQFSTVLGYQFEAAHDMSSSVVNFPGPFHAFDVSPVTITQAPLAAQGVAVGQRLVDDRTVLWHVPTSFVEVLADGLVRADLLIPRPATPTLYTSIDSFDESFPHIVDWRPASQDVVLSWPTLRETTVAPIYDASSTQIRWEESSDGEAGNLARAVLSWPTPEGPSITWTIVSPRGEDPVIRVPLLPREELHPRTDAPQQVQTLRLGDEVLAKVRTNLIGPWNPAFVDPFNRSDPGRDWAIEGPSGTVVWRSAQVPFR